MAFVARRLFVTLFQLLGLALVVFFAIRALPADPVARLVGQNASREAYLSSQHALGLDRPVMAQLGSFLLGLAHGDLGRSWVSGLPVLQEIRTVLPITLELITYAFVLAFVISVPLGMMCAVKPGGVADTATFSFSLFAGSQPEFWWGLLFIYVFFAMLGWAPPPLGRLDPSLDAPARVTGFILVDSLLAGNWVTLKDGAQHLALPVLTKVFVLSGPIIKMVRGNMVRVLSSDYLLHARASGLKPWTVAGYALKNGLAPALTLLGVLYGYILGSAVLIETVFSLGGIGQYAVRSVLAFDYPAIQAVVLVIAAISLFVYLALDLLHLWLDPRPRRMSEAVILDEMPVARAPLPGLLFRLGAVLVLLALVLMLVGPWLAPFDPGRPTDSVSEPPPGLSEFPGLVWAVVTRAPHDSVHWFGTDSTGLDIFSRVIAAPRTDVMIAVGANLLSLVAGTLLGLAAGTLRSWVGALLMRVSDLLQAFPVFITGMILVTLAGRSNGTIVLTLALLYTPIYIRLTRSEVVVQGRRGFVDASRALGRGTLWIALRHVLPNALAPSLIQASVTIGFAILMTAGLSFVGAGVRPPAPEWGLMIASGADQLVQGDWWPSVFPGLAISLVVFGFAAFGSGLERLYAR